MPASKDLKRVIRARMKKTGEAYTAARANVLKTRPRAASPRATAAAGSTENAAAPIDHAALAGMADAKVREKTGRDWQQWTEVLDSHDAVKLPHREIAELVSSRYGVPDWWCQTVTVGYERIKGLRARGQRRDGTYEASKSRTFDVPLSWLYAACSNAAIRRKWLDDNGIKVRSASKSKYMRLGFDDGTVVVLGFMAKGKSKSALAVQHTKLPDRSAVDGMKRFWNEKLGELAEVLKQ